MNGYTVRDAAGRERSITITARPWVGGEDSIEIEGARVLGPVSIWPDGGGRIDALAIEDDKLKVWAIYWCRYVNAWRVVPVSPDVEAAIAKAVLR